MNHECSLFQMFRLCCSPFDLIPIVFFVLINILQNLLSRFKNRRGLTVYNLISRRVWNIHVFKSKVLKVPKSSLHKFTLPKYPNLSHCCIRYIQVCIRVQLMIYRELKFTIWGILVCSRQLLEIEWIILISVTKCLHDFNLRSHLCTMIKMRLKKCRSTCCRPHFHEVCFRRFPTIAF